MTDFKTKIAKASKIHDESREGEEAFNEVFWGLVAECESNDLLYEIREVDDVESDAPNHSAPSHTMLRPFA